MSTKTYVSSAALHMIKTDDKPTVAAAVAAILSESDLVDVILSSSVGSLAGKVSAAFAYAESDYALALPSGRTTQLNTPTKASIASAIADDISYPLGVLVTKFIYTPYQPYHEVLDYLIAERAFNSHDNTIHKFGNLKFNNGQVIHIMDSSVSVDGLSVDLAYAYYEYQEQGANDAEGGYYTQVVWAQTGTYTETIARPSTANITYEDNCLIAAYTKLNSLGEMLPDKYVWLYRIYTNKYPALNNVASAATNDKYFPVVPLRYNNVDLTAESLDQTNLHITSKRLLRILDVSFESMGKQLNDSPDIASIDHAYLMFGANLQSDKPATLAYLNHYFDYLATLNTSKYVSADADLSNLDDPSISFTEHGLSLAISFGAINTTYLVGKIDNGIVGNARKSISYSIIPGTFVQSFGGEGASDYTTPDSMTSTLTLDLQITASVFRRVTVTDLIMTNKVYPGFPVITSLKDVKDDPENNNFILPLEYKISLWLSYPDRTKLYADSFLLVLNTVLRIKLKWYQQSWVGGLIMMIAIIIAAYSGQAWLVGLAKLGTAALILAVAKVIIIGIAVSMAMKWVVKKIGAKLGVIGALILATVALILTQGRVGAELIAQYTLQTAQIAMACSMALIDAANESIAANMKAITTKYDAFSNLLKEAYEAMEDNPEVQALDFKTMYDPLAIIKTKDYYEVPAEYAHDFFERTLGLPYNNVYGIHEAIPRFVKDLLTIDNNTVMSTY